MRSIPALGLVWLLVLLAPRAGGAPQRNFWEPVFSLETNSPSFAGSLPTGSPGDMWLPGPPPRRVISREELGVPATVTPLLPQGGVVDAFSAGMDNCGPDLVLFFYSVRLGTVGAGYPVTPEVNTDGAAGDLFVLVTKGGCPTLRGATLEMDAPDVVLVPFPGSVPVPALNQDELSTLDIPFAYRIGRTPVYFSVNAATAALMAASSGLPVTGGDILMSNRQGDWAIAVPHASLSLTGAGELDALAVQETIPGSPGTVYFSVRGPVGSAAASGLNPATVYTIVVGSGSGPIAFLPPSQLGCLPTDDVDAISILDPGLFTQNYAFTSIVSAPGSPPGSGPPPGTFEEEPLGVPDDTLWHTEPYCSWDGTYIFPGPNFPGFSSIVGSPGAVLIHGAFVDDDMGLPSPLPFPFRFAGVPKTSFQVSANGFVVFDQALGSGFFTNAPIGNPSLPNDYAAAWWDDLHTGSSGSVLSELLPSGDLVIEWNNVEAYPANASGEFANFQVVLSPSPVADTVRFNYGSITSGSDPWSATVGIEGVGGAAVFDPMSGSASNSYFPWGTFSTVELTPNVVPLPSSFGGTVVAYNLGDQGIYDYDTQGPGGSVANTGALVMPSGIPLGTKDLTFSFDYMKETEGGGTATFDQCFVEVRRTFPAGQPWLPLGTTGMPIPGNSACPSVTTISETAANPLSPLSSLLGDGGSVRFRFDTLDAIGNAFQGWYVGNGGLQGGPVGFFQRYGVGCAPAGAPLPRIGSSGAPLSPSVIALELDDGPPSAPLALLINTSLGMPLPTPLSAFGLPAASPACNFEIGLFPFFPMIVPAVSNPAGAASVPVAIPPGISGEVFAQWACVTPSATFSMSDGAIFAVR
jgi:hypothetical protein